MGPLRHTAGVLGIHSHHCVIAVEGGSARPAKALVLGMAGALWIYGVSWLLLVATLAVHRSNAVMLGVAVVMFAATPVLFGAIVWGLIADKACPRRRRSGAALCSGPRRRYRSGGALGLSFRSRTLPDRLRHE